MAQTDKEMEASVDELLHAVLPPEFFVQLAKEKIERNKQQREYKHKWKNNPENKAKAKLWAKTYYQRPEVKARIKAYRQTPERKAKHKIWRKTYNQRPEIKEKHRQLQSTQKYKAHRWLSDRLKRIHNSKF